MKIEKILQGKDNSEIFMLEGSTPLPEAVEKMAQNNYGAVLVTENGEFCGIFTERDLMSCVAYCSGDLTQLSLKDVMTKDPTTIGAGEDIMKALSVMTEGRFRHLPITNDNGNLTGVVSYIDLVKWLLPGASSGKTPSIMVAPFIYRYAGTIISIALLACGILGFLAIT